MRREQVRRATGRRGVTLLEMLVVVALVVLMMLILASIFQAATGAMSAMRTYQELDDNLRHLDLTIRQDLTGSTAVMTPPNRPLNKTGYFEYGENAPADAQGEDTDDYIAFTAKAPQGRVFTGRVWVPFNIGIPGGANAAPPNNGGVQPVTITSEFAEIIYFLRNGNLYRRVLLIVPERRGAIAISNVAPAGVFVANTFQSNIFNNGLVNPSGTGLVPVSWFGVNDISARPNDGPDSVGSPGRFTPVPNDLGDLTNRENRFARQRFARDYFDIFNNAAGRDGILDETNNDLIPDFYPTLTWTQVLAEHNGNAATSGGTPTLMNENPNNLPPVRNSLPTTNDMYAFPFIFPGMYSKPEAASLDINQTAGPGWLHALDTGTVAGAIPPGSTNVIFNHAPVEYGDSLPVPTAASQLQTWWGFPTFRETASINWHDPVFFPGVAGPTNTLGAQVHGLKSFPTGTSPGSASPPFNANFLPSLGSLPPLGTPGTPATPFGSEGAGNPTLSGTTVQSTAPFVTLTTGITVSTSTNAEQLSYVWDDDLIMTGVRSFDVKAYDQNMPLYNLVQGNASVVYAGSDYKDLGYASTDYTATFGAANNPLLFGTPAGITDGVYGTLFTDRTASATNTFGNPLGFGHEGRIPPLSGDNRLDPQRPAINLFVNVNGNPTSVQKLANNVGDDSVGLNRLRRVWDSWSYDYTAAPAVDATLRGASIQPPLVDRPVYPSYPPPYPQAMRGLQIQIRVVDPQNQKVKVLTIRHDFSDKL